MNAGPRKRHGYRRLVRTILKKEESLRSYVPTPRPAGPAEPRGADEVLAALASRYSPGDALGLQQVVDCIGVEWDHARAVRAWAQYHGAWPYVRPSPRRPASRPDPGPKRKGGGS